MRPPTSRLLVALALAALAAAATAQEPAEERERRPWVRGGALGLRLGLFEPVNSGESYDAVFGDPAPMVGLQLELHLFRHLLLALTLDDGEADGEQVLLTRPTTPTGVDTTLGLTPAHLTVGWLFRPQRPWRPWLGAGPTMLSWEQETSQGSSTQTDYGAHLVAGLRRTLTRRWEASGELRWSTVPDALEGGAAEFFDEDDLGGLALTIGALWSWGQ